MVFYNRKIYFAMAVVFICLGMIDKYTYADIGDNGRKRLCKDI